MNLAFLGQGLIESLGGLQLWPPAVALLLPLIFGLLLAPFGFGLLARFGLGQRVRVGGPEEHHAKEGTPTAGGLIVIALILVTVFLIDRRRELLPVLAALALGAGFGLVDDLATLRSVGVAARGLMARQRIIVQLAIGGALGFWFMAIHADTQTLPLLGAWRMGWLIVPVAALALAATANAFNLTDGSDGLAPGVMVIVVVVLALMARNLHQVALVRLLLATAGALLAFLVYNLPPARVFLGGVGSEGIGMMIAAASISLGLVWLLPLLALVPVLETLSVIIQVASFKTRGRRAFRMAPLHHHFQVGGWNEWTVALAGWAASLAAGTIGLLLTREALS